MSPKSLETTLEPLPPGLFGPPEANGELGQLAQYRILRLIERGGMGIVFLAEDRQLRRPVALKIIRPEFANDDDSRARFLREARAIAALKHDNVVTIYHVGEERGAPFLVMELLQGKSLKVWLESGHRPTVNETVAIGRQVAKALMAAHKAGLVHRDLKPGNLWLEAPSGRVKLLDFGLVRSTNPQVTMAGDHSLVGTPVFMSPEQACGEPVDARSDLFSLGSVLYLLATGTASTVCPGALPRAVAFRRSRCIPAAINRAMMRSPTITTVRPSASLKGLRLSAPAAADLTAAGSSLAGRLR